MQSHKELTNLSNDLRTKHVLTRRSDSLHPTASQLSILKLSIALHCFLLKQPLDYRKFWPISPGADPKNFGGEWGFKLGWMFTKCKDVRRLDPEKGVNKFFENVVCKCRIQNFF